MQRDAHVGASPEWIAQPERGNRLAIRFIVWTALTLGRPAARLLLYPICLYFLIFSRASRKASLKFLGHILGRRPHWGDVYRNYFCFASTILDRVFLLNNRYDLFELRLFGAEIVAELHAAKNGALLLGAHVGSFEVTRAIGRTAYVPRVNLVMYADNATKINSVLDAINPELAMNVIALGHVDSMLKVDAALTRGEFVGILADRSIEGERSRRIDFLGDAAAFPTGPFRIAGMLGRPIVLMFGLYRGGNRYDIHFEQLAGMQAVEGATRAQLVEAAQRRYVERLQHYARLAPYNWFNFYDFWK